MTKKRPIGVTILVVLIALETVLVIIHMLQMLHLLPLPAPLGEVRFFTLDPAGAVLAGILAAFYIWLIRKLWTVDPEGWGYAMGWTATSLAFDASAIIGGSAWQAMMPAMILNGIILGYCMLPSTREAFGTDPESLKEESA